MAPSVQCRKVWLTPTSRCRTVMLPRREIRMKFVGVPQLVSWSLTSLFSTNMAISETKGCPKLPNRSQPLVGRSSPYCGVMRRTYCCLTSFFPIVDTGLSCEDMAQQSCVMVPRWRFFASCILQRATCSAFQTCILNSKGRP